MCPTQAPDYRYRDDPIAMGYADDSTFYGPREQVLAGVATYAEHITAVGLTIETKVTKNFAWPLSASTRTSYSDNEEETITVQYKDETMQGGQGSFDLHLRNGDTGTAVLGVPIGDDAHVGAYMGAKRQGWAARLDALLDLPNVRRRGPRTSTAFEPGVQCAMYIARKCETHRLMFYLRTVPAAQWRHVMRQAADDMRAFVLKLSGCELELVDSSSSAALLTSACCLSAKERIFWDLVSHERIRAKSPLSARDLASTSASVASRSARVEISRRALSAIGASLCRRADAELFTTRCSCCASSEKVVATDSVWLHSDGW